MSGIQYLTDKDGRRVAVQIDLREHAELWEEFEDLLTAKDRADEESVSLQSVKEKLQLSGRLLA